MPAAKATGEQRRRSEWKVRMNARWKKRLEPERKPNPSCKIQIKFLYYFFYLETHLQFSDMIRFAIHVPAAGASPAAIAGASPPARAATAGTTTDGNGMVVVMYHPLQGKTGLVFCRSGDPAWTKVDNAVVEKDGRSSPFGLVDFAFFDGKIFSMHKNGVTAVIDVENLEVVDLVDVPPETTNVSTKLFPYRPEDDDDDDGDKEEELVSFLHLVALPRRLLLVRIQVTSSGPESFDVFELARSEDDDDDGMEWHKVIVLDDDDGGGGGYDLYLDGHHATFCRGGGGGNRIYYVHGKDIFTSSSSAAYCYSMVEDNVECVYRSPEEDDREYTTRPSWFVA